MNSMHGLARTSVIERFENLAIETRPYINGTYVTPLKSETIEKTCPANGQAIAALHACSTLDVDVAVRHANEAFQRKVWLDKSKEEKKKVLFELARLMEAEIETLAWLDTLETGRAYVNFIQDSIPKAVGALRWFAEAIDKYYEHLSSPSPRALSLISREALGVVGIITPWNDPLVVSMWKLAPALLMGNSVVLKPAEQSSYSILRVAALAKAAGIPDGVFNVLPGLGHEAGKAIAMHPEVRGVFFTGSSEVGKQIIQYAGASNMKKVGLECGGKSAFIVSDRCTALEQAAQTLARNMFYNQGQICSAPSRLLVHKDVKDRFLQLLQAELPKYQPGNPFDLATRIGALSSREQQQKVTAYIDKGIAAGYRKLTPEPQDIPCSDGCYVAPTVFVDVPVDAALAQEEIFGPVLVTHAVDDMVEAIRIANGTRYGLAASIWSNDLDEALACAKALQAGIVHINSYGDDDNTAPFGGVKESGIGRDKSVFAFEDYSTLKTTWIRLNGSI